MNHDFEICYESFPVHHPRTYRTVAVVVANAVKSARCTKNTKRATLQAQDALQKAHAHDIITPHHQQQQ
jgi:hypothetical protein